MMSMLIFSLERPLFRYDGQLLKTHEFEPESEYDKMMQPLIQGTRLAALYDALEKNRALQGKLKGVMEKVSLR